MASEPKVGDWVRLDGSSAIGEVREVNGTIDSGPVFAVWFGEKGPFLALPSDVREVRSYSANVAHSQEMMAMLKHLEWSRYMNALCPICEHGSNRGHAPDCRLARLIGGDRV